MVLDTEFKQVVGLETHLRRREFAEIPAFLSPFLDC